MSPLRGAGRFHVDVPGCEVAVGVSSLGAGGDCVVLAHGAGGDMQQPLLVHLQSLLAASGRCCVRFNFPYAEAGRRAPDRPPRLLAAWRAVLAAVRTRLAPRRLIVGGRSMGGRMASMLVAEGEPADALLLLAYPLHPAGRRERLRDAHFPSIRVPSLFVQGTRDALCDAELMADAASRLHATATLHWVEGGDHGFRVPRRAAVDPAAVQGGIDAAVLSWLEGLR